MATVQITPERGGIQPAHSQIEKLETLIAAAQSARHAAARDLLFCSRAGVKLLDVIHNLIEVDGVHDLAADVRREVCMDDEGTITLPTLRPISIRPVTCNLERFDV